MEAMKLDQRFFESTRGQIVTLLRGSPCTVEELATKLALTDNAVRAHLSTLERDGLVRQSGIRRGARKPHFTYALTDDADQLFPKAYDALLNQLIAVLKSRLNPAEIEDVLREVGRAIAATTLLAARGSKVKCGLPPGWMSPWLRSAEAGTSSRFTCWEASR